MSQPVLPRILVIDDLFGRVLAGARNEDRANLCGQYLLRDISGDEVGKRSRQAIKQPVAEVVFHRGQVPMCSNVGDVVENDLVGAVNAVRSGWCSSRDQCWSLVLLDLCFYTGHVTLESNAKAAGMPEGRDGDVDPKRYFGLRILEVLHEEFPDLPVVILSSKPRGEVSREFTVRGALGFLERDASDSPALLRDYLYRHGLIGDESGEIKGQSRALLKALRAARRVSRTRQNVLIRGERGTGKELLARYVHRQTESDAKRPFVVVDSGTLSPELYGSTLFGHKRGAFTGATESRIGAIQEGDGGDLFLDEIGNMPELVQTGLLRVLEDRRLVPLGGGAGDARQVDVRFVSATNADIEAASSSGGFREDLYDRLREGGVLFLPPLRDRKEDIPVLVEQFVREAEAQTPNALRREVEPAAMTLLCEHQWPGNIRQLRQSVFAAVAHHPDVEHLQPMHLDLPAKRSHDSSSVRPNTVTSVTAGHSSMQEVIAMLNSTRIDGVAPAEYAGKWFELQEAWGHFLARYLKAGLEATRRLRPGNPAGEVLPLPAVQFLTGDSNLKAWQAYDIIKQVCQSSPALIEELRNDPVLREVFERATKARSGR
jgi:DNA-binding NtrC family response regulator